jgi:hypothetical protein
MQYLCCLLKWATSDILLQQIEQKKCQVSSSDIYEMSVRRHFSRMSSLFEHERRRSECYICTNVSNTSSRIEVRTIFLKTNIMSDLSCTLCEYFIKHDIQGVFLKCAEIFPTRL